MNLMILADESMNGPDKVVPIIKRIDNERSESFGSTGPYHTSSKNSIL